MTNKPSTIHPSTIHPSIIHPSVIHPTAAKGFGSAVESYIRGRPGYPPEIEGWLSDTLGIGDGKTVVELGAGTGKFTTYLLNTGAHVIAIEPVQPMLDKLVESFPNIETHTGLATAIPLPDASVDAVLCAQSFHWFATPEALTEIHRVLKPDGKLGLIWNKEDENTHWVARLQNIINRYEGDSPRYYNGKWRRVFPFPGFGPLHETHFSFTHTGSLKDIIFNRVHSTSFIAGLPLEEQEKINTDLHALIEEENELRGKSVITMPYETGAFYTVKTE